MGKWVIGKYIRLSQADRDLMIRENKAESESISHQKALIQNFISGDPELAGCEQYEFFDDGYSGTNFERPSFERLLEKIKNGAINCVIVKDFSRFGRDYIELGDYLERIFPFLGVRFISINDHYDSQDYKGTTGGLDVVMKNIVYDYYSKDLSVKVTTAKRAKMKRGEYIGGHVPYGLKKDPEDYHKLAVDPEAAAVVREIFEAVVFNHTAEGNEQGPFFSFKGFDNRVYYMLTPDGMYYNFSGCGNTLNCNHPVVQMLILECLRYWTIEYHVDGFRFDLASILGRNEDGSPMSQPPLLKNLAEDPILRNVKLIAEAWDAGGLYQVGNFPAFLRWAEWNGKYRDDMRSFLKGDYWFAEAAANRLTGSADLYSGQYQGYDSSINFLTCHDGFSLWDLYSYNEKHNEDNGWNNTDGSDDNRSWNCGAEGETSDPEIQKLRFQMIKNACMSLMCSRGTPMFLSGDEFGDTRFGNNNPYCQDNEISWLNWNRLEENRGLYSFFKKMIWFRREHPAIRSDQEPSETGFPAVSVHTNRPWDSTIGSETKALAICYAGKAAQGEDLVYMALNVYWEGQKFELPKLPDGYEWRCFADTALDGTGKADHSSAITEYWMHPRSAAVFTGVKR